MLALTTLLLAPALVLAQSPTRPSLAWDFAANVTIVQKGSHTPPAVVAFRESELASATEQFLEQFDLTQGTVAQPAKNETLTVLPFFDEKICFAAVDPVTDAKTVFQDAVAKVLGFKSYIPFASAWKKAKFLRKDSEGRDIWEALTHEHDMTEQSIIQTTHRHLLHFETSTLHMLEHETRVNTTTNIGTKAACPFNNTCCHEPGSNDPAKGWGCCPTPGATCCEDKVHCCPTFLPVCDVKSQMCKPQGGGMLGALPFAHPKLTKGLNRTVVQPLPDPPAVVATREQEKPKFAKCEGNADRPKCVPCAKGSSAECVDISECERSCQLQYKCEATKADGGGWNWKCVEQPFHAGHASPGTTPKAECTDQCTDHQMDRYGCKVTGETVADAHYSCSLLDPGTHSPRRSRNVLRDKLNSILGCLCVA